MHLSCQWGSNRLSAGFHPRFVDTGTAAVAEPPTGHRDEHQGRHTEGEPLLAALLRSEGFLGRGHASEIFSGEHHTRRVHEPKQGSRGPTVGDTLAMLPRYVGAIRALEGGLAATGRAARGRSNHRLFYLFARFLLTHACHHGPVRWEDSGPSARNWQLLGASCDCYASVKTRGRGGGWRTSAAARPGTPTRGQSAPGEIADHHLRPRERFTGLLKASAMTSAVVDTVAQVSALWLG